MLKTDQVTVLCRIEGLYKSGDLGKTSALVLLGNLEVFQYKSLELLESDILAKWDEEKNHISNGCEINSRAISS